MRKGQRASSSSESEESRRPWFNDSEERSSLSACTSGVDSSSSDLDTEAEMKRSERFSASFSFREDQQLEPEGNVNREEEEEDEAASADNGEPVTQQVKTEPAGESTRVEKQDVDCNRSETPRPGLFRPQRLWLAMTRCLALRWPHCFSIDRKLAFQVDLNQSEDTQLSLTSESTNQSSSTSSTSDDGQATAAKRQEEEVVSKRVKSAPPPRRGISRSSPRCPRQSRQVTDSVLASVILEREMFLRIELTDSGEERDDLRYRAEWKLSERTKELAEGVWLSHSQME